MGLFVLKDASGQLLQLSFEEILNEIAEQPKAILAPDIYKKEKEEAQKNNEEEEESKQPVFVIDEDDEFINIYQHLRLTFRQENGGRGSLLDFHLDRLKAEFEESHSAAKLQPKHNKSSIKTRKNPYHQAQAAAAMRNQ